jgi:hypothetical protein
LVDEAELEKVLSINLEWPNSTVAEMVDGVTGARVLDSWGAVSSHLGNGDEERSDITSERIYAISTRKICFKWFSQDELEDKMVMTNNRWSYHTAKIGGNISPKTNEQVVEVNLGDEDTESGVSSQFIPFDEDNMPLKAMEYGSVQ